MKFPLDEKKKKVIVNFIWLSIVQVVNYILPLIITPYLILTIGIEKIGQISFATAVCTYFCIITDYGFNLTATKGVAEYKDDVDKLVEIFTSVFVIKLTLSIICAIFLALLIFFVKKIESESLLFYMSFLAVIGQVITPLWFFQGMEDMKYITYLNICAKVISTVAILLLVKSKTDYLLVPSIYGFSAIFVGMCGVWLVVKKYKVGFGFITLTCVKHAFKDGWHIFTANIFATLYRNSIPVFMGFISTEYALGVYSVAEKVTKIIQSVQNVAGNAIYPYIIKKFGHDKSNYFRIKNKYRNKAMLIYVLLTLLVVIFSTFIAKFLNHTGYEKLSLNIIIQAPVIFFGGMSYFYGILGLVALGMGHIFSRAVLKTGLITLIICPIMIYVYADIGGSLTFAFAELFLFVLLALEVNKLEKI